MTVGASVEVQPRRVDTSEYSSSFLLPCAHINVDTFAVNVIIVGEVTASARALRRDDLPLDISSSLAYFLYFLP